MLTRAQRTAHAVRIWRSIKRPRRPMWRRRLPRQYQPTAARVAYFRAIRTLLDRARALVERELLPRLPHLLEQARREREATFRTDAPGDEVNKLMDELSKKYFDELRPSEIEALAVRAADETSRFQKVQLDRQVRAAFGVDVLHAEPSLRPLSTAFVSENVALIKSIPNKYLDDVEATVTRAIRRAATPTDLTQELQERYEVSESRARLIARDQLGKYYGQINQARQQALGVEEYVWETSQDERVREEHADRQGEVFRWDDPPEGGHPGEDYQCRCFAAPVLDEITESVDEEE